MADKVKNSNHLKLVAGFADGDDRTITIENPKSDITAEQINALKPYAIAAIQGDKTGATCTGWRDAKVVQSTTVYLDITPSA